MMRMVLVGACLLALGCSETRLPDVTAVPDTEISAEDVRNLKTDGHYYLSGVLTEDGLADIRARGVETVIDLRQPEQVPANYADQVKALGFSYRSAPLRSDGMTVAEAEEALDVLRKARDWPVLLQCGSGNRVGALYALHIAKRRALTVEDTLDLADDAGLKHPGLREDLTTVAEALVNSDD